MKDGKKSSKMKKVIICEARQALLGGWKFIIRLIWREREAADFHMHPGEQARETPGRHWLLDTLPASLPSNPSPTTSGSRH